MKGREFIDRVKDIGRARGVEVRFDAGHGKGSHGRLYFGSAWTTVKDRKKEIGRGLLIAMIRQLGLDPDDFR